MEADRGNLGRLGPCGSGNLFRTPHFGTYAKKRKVGRRTKYQEGRWRASVAVSP